jgi:predicted acyl esterase
MARWIVSAAILTALLLPGGAAAGTQPAWWSYDRPATYTTARTNTFVFVRDGTPIHCVVDQPADTSGNPLAGPFPALITNYTPYGATNALGALPGGDNYWSDHGYVALSCDVRGTGLSGGVWQGLLSPLENVDNYDILAWMRQQPWSNGRLGQIGVSYGGMTSMRVASLHPAGLLAISPLSSEDDLYLEDVYPGGIKSTPGTGDVWPWLTIGLSGGREIAPYTEAQYLQHPLWDDFWQQIAVSTKWRDITVPILGLGGWNDTLVPGGAPSNWIGLRKAGNRQNYLIMGPWGHAATGAPAPLPRGVQLAFIDRWVMGLRKAPLPSSAVTSYEQPAGGAGTVRGRTRPCRPIPATAASTTTARSRSASARTRRSRSAPSR